MKEEKNPNLSQYKDEHKGNWIAYAGCKCKWCKKASKGTQKIMRGMFK